MGGRRCLTRNHNRCPSCACLITAYPRTSSIQRWIAPDVSIFARADAKWDEAVTSGGNLWAGMQSDDRKASFLFRTDPHTKDPLLQTVQSPHDGDLIDTMLKWGYFEDPVENAKIDKECDFDAYQGCKRAFAELGIKTASKGNGGPNWCVQWDHQNGPKVVRDKDNKLPPLELQKYVNESCGKEYRVTGGTFEYAVNVESGFAALLNVISPAYSTQQVWKRKPLSSEMPHIRSISDVAWGVWHRATGGKVKDIKYLMVANILNKDTKKIVRSAHETLTPKRSEVAVWPGFDFATDTPAGKALLGSPVGRWAGYFLMQHKTQLGGNKNIPKVRVFKPDGQTLAWFIFYIGADPDPNSNPETGEATGEAMVENVGGRPSDAYDVQIIKRGDGGNVIREHVFRAKL
ncbi:hypothetical protein BKA63DRAFT_528584 [Paraphoma chrysanthemicola]|nr:hypothetical protein BKA63DRAFT_528584 [Paraphoma chrysanthemicola]